MSEELVDSKGEIDNKNEEKSKGEPEEGVQEDKPVDMNVMQNFNYDDDLSGYEDYGYVEEGEDDWEIIDDKFPSKETVVDWEKEAKKSVRLDAEERRGRRKTIYELDSYASSGPSVNDLLKLSTMDVTEAPAQVRYSVSMGVSGIARINLSPLTQKVVGCVIGENVSTEYPWVYVRKEIIEDNIDLHEESSDFLPIKEEIRTFPSTKMLIGYVPSLTEEGQFYICLTEEGQEAVVQHIQRQREEHENRVRTAVYKPLGEWFELGSSDELHTTIVENTRPLLQIEVVSTAELLNTEPELVDRNADDQRDGYVELLPYRQTFDNVARKLLYNATQVTPMLKETAAQTVLSMPRNLWVQYQYEYDTPDISKFTEDRMESLKSFLYRYTGELCDQALLNATWDIYTNDYLNLIRDIRDTQWTIPAVYKEHLSFHDSKRSFDKVINDLSWHPIWSGVAFAAYVRYSKSHHLFGPTPNEEVLKDSDDNFVLVWSFTDSLTPKLVLECPREITTVAVNPLDGNIVIGGCVNGQVALWHIPGKIEQVEAVIAHTAAQIKYRVAIKSLTTWMQEVFGTSVIQPTAMSSLKQSQKEAISQIAWTSSYDNIDESGRIKPLPEDTAPEDLSMQFVTTSADGTIAFWNIKQKKLTRQVAKRKVHQVERPEELQQSISPYKVLDRIFKPHYILAVQHPDDNRKLVITTLSIYTPQFEKVRVDTLPDSKDVTTRRFFKNVIKKPNYESEPRILIGTDEGDFGCITWEGYEFATDLTINTEPCQWIWLKKMHDGPVVNAIRSQFCKNVVATIGGKVFAVWRDDFGVPLTWKKSDVAYTACSWGSFRPTILLLARMDGNIEIWDFMVKSEEPCLSQSLSGRIITGIYTHELFLDPQCVGFCDFNGTFRMYLTPFSAMEYDIENIKWMENFVQRQTERITKFNNWQKAWNQENCENIERLMKLTKTAAQQMQLQEKNKSRVAELELPVSETKAYRPWEFLEQAREKWKEMELKHMQQVLLEKKGLRKDDLEKQRAPILKMRQDAKKKKEKLGTILEKQDKIFTRAVTVFFPKHYKESKRFSLSEQQELLTGDEEDTVADTILQQEVQEKVVDPYEEIISHFVETQKETLNILKSNPYVHSFDWRKILKEGKSRRISLDTKLRASKSRRISFAGDADK